MRVLSFVIPLILLTGCAVSAPSEQRLQVQARDAARLDEALAGFTPGKPVSCLPNRDVRGPEAYGDSTLLFRVGRNLIYRSETRGSCRGVARGDALITRQYSSRLCSGDIARTADLQGGFESGSCALGEFVPYRRKQP